LNRARLPGYPRGVGAGGTSYQPAEHEVAILNPVDDLPPITVITHVRIAGGNLLIRGITADNGNVKKVLVNGIEARATAPNFAEWEAVLGGVRAGPLYLSAHAEDAKGNVEKTKHVLGVVVR
jgi:hypothetical protein